MRNESNPQEKKDALTLAIEKNPCGTCRACGMPPPCKGHAGKGGGKSGGKTDNIPSGKQSAVDYSSPNLHNVMGTHTVAGTEKNLAAEWNQLLKAGNTVQFEAGLLAIENKPLLGILQLRAKPGLSEEESELVRHILKTIKTEFDEFKEELQEKRISTSQFTAVIEDNHLKINIPNPKYFSEFMQRLADKNLLPHPAIHDSEQILSQTNEKKKYPSPFDISKGPKLPGRKDDK